MAVALVESYGDLLAVLKEDRRAHSLAVGRKAEAAAADIPAALRADVVLAMNAIETCLLSSDDR